MQKSIANNHRVSPMSNDLYQFTCSYGYFLCNKHEQIATFECFYRKNPFKGEYCILAGIRELVGFISQFKFTVEDLKYLRGRFPEMKSQFFDWLGALDCSQLRLETFREGEIVFPNEPLAILTGPMALIQIIETPLLNLLGFSTLVATNASRIVKAARNKPCVEFGLRRAQGPDGGLSASQYSFLGGFTGTSNSLCGKIFGIPTIGTMSHAFITSFFSLEQVEQFQIEGVKIKETTLKYRAEYQFQNTHTGELASFLLYARAFPNNFITLIDSYSTVNSGLKNTIIIAKALQQAKITNVGVRLDSGDLTEEARKCKALWSQYFGYKLTVFASNDLSEDSITKMENSGSEVDVYAVGTNIATCQKQPALGVVYKLVEIKGKPTMKLSEEAQKMILPARKNVYRVWCEQDKDTATFDLITLHTEQLKEGQDIDVVEHKNMISRFSAKVIKFQKLNSLVWFNGKVVHDMPDIYEAKNYYEQRRKIINSNVFCLEKPEKHRLFISKDFHKVFVQTIENNIVVKELK